MYDLLFNIEYYDYVYKGAFTADYRRNFIQDQMQKLKVAKIQYSDDFKLENVLEDHVVVRDWEVFGLLKDSLSNENAVIIKHSSR